MEPLPEVTDPRVIDGRKIALDIEARVKEEVEIFVKKHGVMPALATILVGEHPPSKLYVKLKHWAASVGSYPRGPQISPGNKAGKDSWAHPTLNSRPDI